jgi:NADP-dependent 3-hydroxy acid dehydrogenase YdfG
MSKVWFITGSSVGFRRKLAEAVLESGERIIATARNTGYGNVSAIEDTFMEDFRAQVETNKDFESSYGHMYKIRVLCKSVQRNKLAT